MALAAGTRLGGYEIQSPLGAGGMGEVYRALDSRLKRSVAIKILPADFSNDPERLARFEREAQVLASLNHPNIATIFGVEESGGVRALVMELVEGQTLAERLHRGRLPADEVQALARQLVDALAAAHEKGIVHRDLKPGNIQITPSGALKVLDFGLAKAVEKSAAESDLNSSPTLTAMTQGPVILGTAAYMSPEQARGLPVDQRADIWSFGCVLFEMLAGRRPFSGDTSTDILAGIIRSSVEWNSLPGDTPPAMRRLLQRCLEKDPRRRLQNIADARFDLEESASEEAKSAAAVPPRSRFWWTGWAAAVVLGLAGLAAFFIPGRTQGPPLRKVELIVDGFSPGISKLPILSPDGRRLAYYAAGHLWIRELDQLAAHQVSDADDSRAYFWSADSSQLAYGESRKLWKVSVQGGQRVLICDIPDNGELLSGAWSSTGNIALSVWRNSTYEVPSSGGIAKLLIPVNPKEEVDFHNLSYLPDGKALLFLVHAADNGPSKVSILSGGRRQVILNEPENGFLGDPVYSSTGHLLYTVGSSFDFSIWAAPFSVSSMRVTGEPFVVAARAQLPSAANDGSLAYMPNLPKLRQLAWVGPNGTVERQIGNGQDQMQDPDLSPDGRWAAVTSLESNAEEIWIYEMANGARHRLTFTEGGAGARWPAWSPKGDKIAYTREPFQGIETSIRLINLDGTGDQQIVARGYAGSFTPDGKTFVYTVDNKGKNSLWYVTLGSGDAPKPLRTATGSESYPRFAPTGRYVAYTSDESGREEVYVVPFPPGSGKWQVSTSGGETPRWSPSGDELFFAAKDGLMRVLVSYTPSFSLTAPQRVVGDDVLDLGASYSVARDGKHILAMSDPDSKKSGGGAPIVLVQNWYSEFRKK